jgi:Mrp family chromosome partitioning ATPase
MVNILKKILLSLGIHTKVQAAIFCAAAGVIFIILFVFISFMLRRRKYKKVINVNLSAGGESGDKPAKGSYEPIINRIKQVKRKYRSILFTSTEAEALPVTIPVNVAMGLAKSKKLCLLIDLDLKRDAVAKAFGLDAEQSDLSVKAVQTEIENLWVWPGHYFTQSKQMNVMEIVEKAEDRFDFILINAPALVRGPDYRQIISAARAAFICTKNTSEIKKLAELIKPLDCTIIGHIQIS